jgi:hypothetical protein
MSNLTLFIVGSLVTLLVAASMTLLIWGAVLDGRQQPDDQKAEREEAARSETDRMLQVVDIA